MKHLYRLPCQHSDSFTQGAIKVDFTAHVARGYRGNALPHAKPGSESRHHLSYWRYDDYIGIGPGAHGRRLNTATQRHKKPENFLSAVERNTHGISSEEYLDAATRATESLLMGLRLAEGIDLGRLSQRTGIAAADLLDMDAVGKIAQLGIITHNDTHVTVTPQGMPLLDAILPQIVKIEADASA